MKNHFNKQVEVQGIKKLDSVKGVQALDAKELREIEGGWIREFGAACKRFFCSMRDGMIESGRRSSQYVLGHPGGGRP